MRRRLDGESLDALIVSDATNLHYLSGLARSAFGIGLVSRDWAVLVSVTGFAAEAEHLAAGFDADLVPRGSWRRAMELLTDRLAEGSRIGFEADTIAYATWSALTAALPGRFELISRGQLLIVDIGCVLDGYRSDATRTFATGPVWGEAADCYELVHAAQRAALAAVRPGVSAGDVHEAAASVIAAAGHGERFPHGVGHGVGLELHERPFAEPEDRQPLEPGHVLTIEPGVYLPGRFGVRIEDEIVVSADGHRRLSPAAGELVTLG